MPSAYRPSTLTTFCFGLLLGLIMPLSLLAQPAQGQDSGPSNQEKAMHYSLYYESFKNKKYQDAKGDLEWILENAPGYPKGDARNFRRQYELYAGLAKNAASDKDRRAYLDTAATLLATAPERMKKHGVDYKEYKWEIRKGRFLQEHGDALPELSTKELKDPTTHYRKAFELAPQEVNPYYIQQVLKGYREANEQEKAIEFANLVEEKRGDDEEVRQILSTVRKEIFGKNPQAKVAYLEKQLEAHPDSAGLMLSLFNAYVDLGNISEASKLAPKLMETNPPAETVREIAEMRLEDGRPEEALKAYERATKQGAELKAEDFFNRGKAYQQMNQLSKARQEFRKALEKDPNYGEAYLKIGDLYAQAVSDCSGGELGRDDKAVYWATVDKYREAIDADSSIASVAESKMKSYRDVFPTQEDIFYREDWEKGSTITIDYGCYSWINERTTVRPSP